MERLLLRKIAVAATSRLLARDDDWGDWNDWQDEDEENDNCEKVTPGHNGNVPITACNSYYNYDPQVAPAVAVAVIFGILTGVHLFQAISYKKRYTWVLLMGAAWETIAFIIHSLGAKDQQQLAYATIWNILFLLAPLWINAFVYMTFARMVLYWHPQGRVWKLSAQSIAKWFVIADILTFIIQGVGGSMASPGASANIIKIGLNMYLVGMGLQQLFIVLFVGLMIVFQRDCNRVRASNYGKDLDGRRSWRPLLFALYGALVCITIRIIFRLAEFARGITPDNPLPFHEEYTYALDCFPMMVALIILAVWHPGRFLLGPDSEFTKLTRAEKKALKVEKKAAKKRTKNLDEGAEQLRPLDDGEGGFPLQSRGPYQDTGYQVHAPQDVGYHPSDDTGYHGHGYQPAAHPGHPVDRY